MGQFRYFQCFVSELETSIWQKESYALQFKQIRCSETIQWACYK